MATYDFIIINRSFWPTYPVIGEGLLRLAEISALSKKVAVISQNQVNIKEYLKKSGRGQGVKFFSAWSFSNSASNIVKRIFDNLFFMFWVFFALIIARPKKIYVSTDPPILVPFIVALYSKISKAKYFYHLQDIHPEATNTVFRINTFFIKILKKIDNFSLCNASSLITLNEEMKLEILNRSNTQKQISIIENPSVQFSLNLKSKKKLGFSFTGNIGRHQLMPLLIDAIKQYLEKGGSFEFAFAGGGIHADKIKKLSGNNSLIKYFGQVSSEKAASISNSYEWALSPIEDQITRYSFPSKLSTYVSTGAKILAICSENTSVAKWIKFNKVGIVVNPNVNEVVDIFFEIENNNVDTDHIDLERAELIKNLHMDKFVKNIESIIFNL